MRYCCTYFTLIRTHIVHGCPKLALMKQKNFPTVISAHKKNTLDLSGVIFVDFGPRRRLRQWHWSIRSGGMEQNQVEVFACLRLILGTWGVSPLEVSSFLWEGIQYVRKIYMGTFMPLHHRRHRRGLKTWFYRSGGSHSYDYSFFTMCVGRRAEWYTLRGIEDSTREALKNWLPTVASYPMMLCYICEMGWMTGCVRCKIEHSMVLGTVKMKRTHSRQRIHLFFNGVFNNISAFFIIIALPPGIPQSVWELPVGIRIGIYNNKNHWGRQWSNEKTIKILSYSPEESRLERIRIHSLESWLESTYGDIIVRFEPDGHSLPKQRNRSYP